jgi:hypothetical protein
VRRNLAQGSPPATLRPHRLADFLDLS